MQSIIAIGDQKHHITKFLNEYIAPVEVEMTKGISRYVLPFIKPVAMYVIKDDYSNDLFKENLDFKKCFILASTNDFFQSKMGKTLHLLKEKNADLSVLVMFNNLSELDKLYHLQVKEKFEDLMKEYQIQSYQVISDLESSSMISQVSKEFFEKENLSQVEIVDSSKDLHQIIQETLYERDNSSLRRLQPLIELTYKDFLESNVSSIVNFKFSEKQFSEEANVQSWVIQNEKILEQNLNNNKNVIKQTLLSEQLNDSQVLRKKLLQRKMITNKEWESKVGFREQNIIGAIQDGIQNINLYPHNLFKTFKASLMDIPILFEKFRKKKKLYTMTFLICIMILLLSAPLLLFKLLPNSVTESMDADNFISLIKIMMDLKMPEIPVVSILIGGGIFVIIVYEIIKSILKSRLKLKVNKLVYDAYEQLKEDVDMLLKDEMSRINNDVNQIRSEYKNMYVTILQITEERVQ